jgi:lipopolysaccharide assembly protein B
VESSNTLLEILALLLPVAAASGWFAASRHFSRKNSGRPVENQSTDSAVVKGLNYYLNEKSEHALEIFAEIIKRQSNPTESQIALGNLFRRNGEVERAIDIHQKLLSEPSLSEEQHAQAIFELGMDFMRAGLFDRAENIFVELTDDRLYGQSSLQQLLQIYQHEREWLKAIECARKLRSVGKLRRGETVSQFFCEMAETAIKKRDYVRARRHLASAQNEGETCVRASLIGARIEILEERYEEALGILKSIELGDSKYLGPVVELMFECYRLLGNSAEQIENLQEFYHRNPSEELITHISKLIQERDGVSAAQQFMIKEIRSRPSLRGLHELLALFSIKPPSDGKSMLVELREITGHLLCDSPKYRCVQCGFSGYELHWRCPSCHHWESVVAIVKNEESRKSV